MVNTITAISIAVSMLILGVALIIYAAIKDRKQKPDYYSFFIMGILWLIIGMPIKNYILSGLGLLFGFVGILNKHRWKEHHKTWEQLNSNERRVKVCLIIGLFTFVLLGFVLLFIVQ